MYSSDRNSMRRVFMDAWRKDQAQEPLQPLERIVADVVRQHPEYHPMLGQGMDALEREFLPEDGAANPFLHMGMHISLQEQLGANRPYGIRELYQRISTRLGDPHQAEHQMMECLGASLWEAQASNRMPDEQDYLDCLRRLLGNS